MSDEQFLSAQEAARRLGVTTTCLYDWFSQSRAGLLVLRSRPFTIEYFQTGRQGQGRIRIAAGEVERIREALRVITRPVLQRRRPTGPSSFPGIHVPLGRPH